MKKRLAIAGLALSGLLLVTSAIPVSAATESKAIQELAAMSPGLPISELKSSLTTYAKENGLTLSQATNKALAENRQSVAAAAPVASKSSSLTQGAAPANAGGGRIYNLGSAKQGGDVFVMPAGYGIINHGHTGIFISKTVLVEAPGRNKKSRSTSSLNYKVSKGAVKQQVNHIASVKTNAANRAKGLTGKNYNMNFAVNKSATGRDMNCSQLVWAAFKLVNKSIDLDGNGGLGVYPYDIKKSSRTTTYKTF
ncbi:hypothetical protein ACFO7V_00460 [Glutamicibacter bergerei]|uniref:Permuted papain-like amidase enzyme, YaeF/YiiX, C92 family n=2 Tax=Glutamicibacter TaxID=1742989 RepID=A0ABV9MFH7_9MICC|nr:hypothetical protein [Glutamicibacter sp. BW80]PCC30361.1 hypothetical protein CIK76_01690 [Glutamicibacter sp. BW80]HBV10800.1 hypothetical protein [Micrococcaceae bacterium]